MTSFFGKGAAKAPHAATPTPLRSASEVKQEESPTPAPVKEEKPVQAAAAPAVAAPAPATAPSKPQLSEEQLRRIEENKRRALERKAAQKRQADGQAKDAATPTAEATGKAEPAATPAEPQAPAPKVEAPAAAPAPAAAAPAQAAAPAPAAPTASTSSTSATTPEKGASPTGESAAKVARRNFFSTPSRGAAKAKAEPSKDSKQVPTPEKTPQPTEKRAPIAAGTVDAARQTVALAKSDSRFSSNSRAWEQYTTFYGKRVETLQKKVMEEAKRQWGSTIPAEDFLWEVAGHAKSKEKEVVILGITFKHMPDRPDVVADFRENPSLSRVYGWQDLDKKLCSKKDEVYIEDAVMRLQMEVTDEMQESMVSGTIIAARGSVTEQGLFKVSATCLPGMPALPSLPALAASGAQPSYMALVSGLSFGRDLAAARDKCLEFLLGRAADKDASSLGGSVHRVVICGGTIAEKPTDGARAALSEADAFLAKLAAEVPVELMPGHGEPASACFPQEPFSPYLFHQVRRCKDFRSVQNPYAATLGKVSVWGHSGQPVKDVMRSSEIPTAMEALKFTLKASHLAPTAPETLAARSYTEADPLVLDSAPHVLFSGCHDAFSAEWITGDGSGTHCVCVPSLEKTAAIVLVNLNDPRDVRLHSLGV